MSKVPARQRSVSGRKRLREAAAYYTDFQRDPAAAWVGAGDALSGDEGVGEEGEEDRASVGQPQVGFVVRLHWLCTLPAPATASALSAQCAAAAPTAMCSLFSTEADYEQAGL